MKEFTKWVATLSPEKRTQLERLLEEVGNEFNMFPLSFAQQRLWFLDQLESGSIAYSVPSAVRLIGRLEVPVLIRSVNELIRRHEALRTIFVEVAGRPLQRILADLKIQIPIIDLRQFSKDIRETECRRLILRDARYPFDLIDGPLLRISVLQLGAEENVLLVNIHHIVSDGWSMRIFIRELATLYHAFSKGQPSPLPELPVQYVDFAIWQRQWLRGKTLEKYLAYWKQQLDGPLRMLELPTDYPRPPLRSFRGKRHIFMLPRSLSEAIQEFSRGEGVTLFMSYLAAFNVLLYRYTGQGSITVGTSIAGRTRSEIEGLIGFFANTLVLRTILSDDLTFRELLQQVKRVAQEAYAYQEIPFDKLVQELQPERHLNQTPLFQVMFTIQKSVGTVELDEIDLTLLAEEMGTAKFDLTLIVEERAEGVVGIFEYSTDLFEAATIERLAGHLQTLLAGIVTNPEQRLLDLPLLPAAERHQLLVTWNDVAGSPPFPHCVDELFEAQVEQTPKEVAVTSKGEEVTYGELNERANQVAHFLQTLGVQAETPVGICLPRGLEMVVALMGVLKAGGVYVPLDPTWPQGYLSGALETISLCLTRERERAAFNQERLSETQWLTLDTAAVKRKVRQQPTTNPLRETTPQNLVYILDAPGRGIAVKHQWVSERLGWLQDNVMLSPSDVVGGHASLTLDGAVREILWPLSAGARLVLAGRSEITPQMVLAHNLTTLHLTPGQLLAFVDSLAGGPKPLPTLRQVFCSGGALPGHVARDFYTHLPGCRLYHLYSPPEEGEATLHVCTAAEKRAVVPVGRPAARAVCVLDESLRLVPIGVPGDVYVAGKGERPTYRHDVQATAHHFHKNPFAEMPGDYLFKTGERGRWLAGGDLEIVGSSERQVWQEGKRLRLDEVEARLMAVPAVRECVVLARESESLRQELVAYVVPAERLHLAEVRKAVKAVLPPEMAPSHYVAVSTLPLTARGRVDEAMLQRTAVVDAEVVQRWEASLQTMAGINQAAVLLTPQQEEQPVVHLADVLPEWQAKRVSAPAAPLDEPVAGAPLAAATRMAFSDGGPLVIPEQSPQTLTAAALQTARHYPDKGLLTIEEDGTEVFQSYQQLIATARRICNGLYKQGLRAGDRVILQLEKLHQHFAAFWGCVLGGIKPVTVAIPPTYTQPNAVVDKLHYVWELLEQPVVLTSRALKDPLANLETLLEMKGLCIVAVDEMETHPPIEAVYDSQPHEVVFYQLTSGSTGNPKCIQETHRSIIAHIHGSAQFNGYTAHDITLNWLPMDHVVPILTFHLKDVYLGCQQIHVKSTLVLTDPLYWLELMEAHRVTHTWSPNFGFKLVSDALEKAAARSWDLSAIQFFMNAGEQVTLPVVEDFLHKLASFGVGQQAMQPAFGMAEVCTCMTYQNEFDVQTGVHRILKTSLAGPLQTAGRGKNSPSVVTFVDLGPPMPGVQIRIVDAENNLLPEGRIGRFQIKGSVLTPGYLHNEAANQASFVGDGWFNSGDLGFIAGGRLTLTGREKEMLIFRGANFYCYEIEDVVNRIEGVVATFVGACAIEDESSGTEALALFFVPQSSAPSTLAALMRTIRREVTKQLGIVPAVMIPLKKEEFPKTTSGKIQRARLKQAWKRGTYAEVAREVDLLLKNRNTLPNWFYRKRWRRKALRYPPVLPKQGRYLVFSEQGGGGDHLRDRLHEVHQECVIVEPGATFRIRAPHHYRINRHRPADYRRLLAELSREGKPLHGILHLWTYGEYSGEPPSLEAVAGAQYKGIYSLLFLVQALADSSYARAPLKLQVVSSYGQPVVPGEPLAYEKAPLGGFIQTISQEMSWLHCSHLDLPGRDLAQDVTWMLQELHSNSGEPQIAYREGKRLVSRLQRVDFDKRKTQAMPFKRGGLYLMTGGIGGAGIRIAQYLLQHYGVRLLLVGRSALPPEKEKGEATPEAVGASARQAEAFRRLEQQKGEVMYEAADVANLQRLHDVVEKAQRHWGCQLDGIIHLAGVFHQRLLVEETPETVATILRAKVLGTWALHQLVQTSPDALFLTFSSVNGYFGGATVGAYAAANSFLDIFCHYQRNKGIEKSFCLAWSMLDEIGMSRHYAMKELTRARGYHLISAGQSIHSLRVALQGNDPHLLIGLDETNRHMSHRMVTEYHPLDKPVAYFTAQETIVPDIEVVDRFQVPSACGFVQVAQLPQTPEGEVDRQALLETVARSTGRQSAYTAPRTPVEKELSRIFAGVLGREKIGIHDNFFEWGGHSLLATRLIYRVQEAFQVEITLPRLFQAPTVATLAQQLERLRRQAPSESKPALQPVARAGGLPLSFAQQRVWLLEQIEQETPLHNIFTAVTLHGKVEREAVTKSFNRIVARHETLRTSFKMAVPEPVQVIRPRLVLEIPLVDLGAIPAARGRGEVTRLGNEEANRPFNLTEAPLLRVTLIRLKPEEHVLLLSIHHIISDAWSMEVLIGELAAYYRHFVSNQPVQLPDLPVQYADFSYWQRHTLQGEFLEEQLRYWRRQLAGAPPFLKLPTDHPRAAKQTFRGEKERLPFSPSLVTALKQHSQKEGVTLFTVLLTAFKVMLHWYSGEPDILVGSPVANRNRHEVEDLIGYFINALVLRTDFSGNPTLRELLNQVHQVVLEAYTHQDLPFEKLLEELKPERHPHYSPFFQVVFNFQSAAEDPLQVAGLTFTPLDIRNTEVAKYDLTLYMWEGKEKLEGVAVYNADLFNVSTISGMLQAYESVLVQMVAAPSMRLSTLVKTLSERKRKQKRMKRKEFKKANIHKLTTLKRKAVQVSQERLVRTGEVQPGQPLPLGVWPRTEDMDVVAWARNNQRFVETALLQHGAILFRDFDIDSEERFREFAEAVAPSLMDYREGSTTRASVGNKVYNTTDYPPEYAISMHNELSYAHEWPGKIFFFCAQAAQQGGETPLVDSRKVLQKLDARIKQKFMKRGVMYVRNLHGGRGVGLSWQAVFATTDKAAVETYCRQGGIRYEWTPDGHLVTSQIRPAIIRHPKTQELVWFNQVDQWHPSNLGAELAQAMQATAKKEEALPINAYYGDGSPLEPAVLAEIRAVTQQETVAFPWQEGDVLLVDNMLVAHGRRPFVGPRKIRVIMSMPVNLEEVESLMEMTDND